MPEKLAGKYSQEGAYPVDIDRDRLWSLGITTIEEDLISNTDYARHDPFRLAEAVLRITSMAGKHLRMKA
ncbi:MAG: hypothetical protein GX872_04690 [Firmicutes bacterium]|nr:hypothetical protein [Bacillota bacterium]